MGFKVWGLGFKVWAPFGLGYIMAPNTARVPTWDPNFGNYPCAMSRHLGTAYSIQEKDIKKEVHPTAVEGPTQTPEGFNGCNPPKSPL